MKVESTVLFKEHKLSSFYYTPFLGYRYNSFACDMGLSRIEIMEK